MENASNEKTFLELIAGSVARTDDVTRKAEAERAEDRTIREREDLEAELDRDDDDDWSDDDEDDEDDHDHDDRRICDGLGCPMAYV